MPPHPTLRDLRRAAGMSVTDVARRVKCVDQTVYAWEQGRKRPRGDMLDRLAAALGQARPEVAAAIERR